MDYILEKRFLSNICSHQYDAFVDTLYNCRQNKDGFILKYKDRNYLCEPMIDEIAESKVHAISFFSGCGGLDIGAQMAGAKVISTLDFDPFTVETVKANAFFKFAEHHCEDVRNVSGKNYLSLLRNSNPEKLIIIGSDKEARKKCKAKC